MAQTLKAPIICCLDDDEPMNFDWQIDPADIFVCASPPEIAEPWNDDITQPIAGNAITVPFNLVQFVVVVTT